MKRFILHLAAAALMTAIFSGTAYASDISSVSISFREEKTEPGTVWEAEPYCSSSSYSISDVSWAYDRDSWVPARKLTCTVTLQAEDENKFTKNPSVSVSNGEKVVANRRDPDVLEVKLNYIPKMKLPAPGGVYFNDEYTLEWEKVSYAAGYEIRVSRNGSSVATKKIGSRNETEADISEYASDDEDIITVELRSVGPSNKKSYIQDSDWYAFDETLESTGDSTYYGQYRDYTLTNTDDEGHKEYASGWQQVNGNWFYFDPAAGNVAVHSAWREINGSWYYFNQDGKMLTGLTVIDNQEYYLSPESGAMMTGWVRSGPDGPWYYFNDMTDAEVPLGARLRNTVTPDGYPLDQEGNWIR